MNLEDYFEMLHKMAQKSSQSPSGGRDYTAAHTKSDDGGEEEEGPLPPEDAAEP
jgi:hypothetical protein